MKPEISVVIPVFNEEESIASLHNELCEVLSSQPKPYELIYVNDGSTDQTVTVLKSFTNATILDLARNYGQSTALDAGFKHARADVVVSLDGDGQNDPHDIPLLLATLESHDVDVVAGWRKNRKDKRGIRFITRIGRSLRASFLGDNIHDSGCTLRVYKREALNRISLQGEMHRYLLALLVWKGFRVMEVPVIDRPRSAGVSKYGYGKAIRGFLDLIYVWFLYRYSERPFHLFGYIGLLSFLLGIFSFFITLHDKLGLGIHLNRDGWFFLTFFFLLMAVIFLSFGMVIDLLMRIHANSSPREERYHIRTIYTEPSS